MSSSLRSLRRTSTCGRLSPRRSHEATSPLSAEAFAALYPVLGLEEVFLKDLFREELEHGEFRAVALGFRSRVEQAIEKIAPALGKKGFDDGLASLAGELASLSIHLIDDDDVKDMVLDVIEDRIGSSK